MNCAAITEKYLLYNNPCFQCNIDITNFLVSHTFEIKFHDIIGQSTVHTSMYSYVKIPGDLQGQMSMLWTLSFQFNSLDSVM